MTEKEILLKSIQEKNDNAFNRMKKEIADIISFAPLTQYEKEEGMER